MATLDVSVAASADDGFWSSGSFSATGQSVGFGNVGGVSYSGFLRFTGLSALAGTTITAAYLQVVSHSAKSGATCNATIRAAAADNVAAPTSSAQASGQARVATSIAWNPVPAWVAGSTYQTPSLVALLQDLVSNGYLASGVALFYIENNASSANANREPASWDHATYAEALLHVEYTPAQTVAIGARLAVPATVYQPTASVRASVARLTVPATLYGPTARVQVSPARLAVPATVYQPAAAWGLHVPARLAVPATLYQPVAAYSAPASGQLFARLTRADALRVVVDAAPLRVRPE